MRNLFPRIRRRTNERLYGSSESFLERIRTGAVTVDELRARAGPYPAEILAGQRSALLLFGAAFLGVNDGIHFANTGIPRVTVVDIDAARLEVMRPLYPETWEFVAADAFGFVEAQRSAGTRYDIVSVDPFTGLMERCRDQLAAFAELARHGVVLGVERGLPLEAPPGWRGRRVERAGLADWLVLEPA